MQIVNLHLASSQVRLMLVVHRLPSREHAFIKWIREREKEQVGGLVELSERQMMVVNLRYTCFTLYSLEIDLLCRELDY